MTRPTVTKFRAIRVSVVLIVCIASMPGFAGLHGLTGPANVSEFTQFALSWSGGCESRLYENSSLLDVSCNSSFTVPGRAAGSYFYDLDLCVWEGEIGEWFCLPDGGITVNVEDGGSQPPGNGTVTVGDYGSDTILDLFVSPNVGAPFVLRQDYLGQVQIVSGLTSAQINTYSSWPQANAWIQELDLDVDGVVDVMVNGISQDLPGVDDQAVHLLASGSPGTILALGDDVREFVSETLSWTMDKNYFYDTAIANGWYQTSVVAYPAGANYLFDLMLQGVLWNGNAVAEDPFDPLVVPPFCTYYECDYEQYLGWYYDGVIIVYTLLYDTSHFSDEAIDLADSIYPAEVMSSFGPSIDIMERVLGTLSCIGLDDDDYDVWDPSRPPDYFRLSRCIELILNRHAAVYNPPPGTYAPEVRVRNLPYLVWWSGEIPHASIHKTDQNLWVSAFAEHPYYAVLFGMGGNLLAEKTGSNHNSDAYLNTRPYATIQSALGPELSWATIYQGDDYYSNNLHYCLNTPSVGRARGNYCDSPGYNSNGYVTGLVNFVGGTLIYSGSATQIWILGAGGQKPVPASAFGF